MDVEIPHRQHVLDPVEAQVAGMYAQATLELLDNEQAERCCEQLADVAELVNQVDGLELLLTVATMADGERARLVENIFGGRLGEPLEGLLTVLAAHGRLVLLRGVARSFRAQLDEREGKVAVSVITARPLDAEMLARIETVVRERLRIHPMMRATVDAGVLGGMVVRVGDRRFDASIATELKTLKDSLTRRRGSRGAAGGGGAEGAQ